MARGLFVVMIALCSGGLLAYLGNQFGRQVGRRKMSFLGLRPRHTSILITVAVGMFISLFTITMIAFFSQRAQVALLGMKALSTEKTKLQKEIDEQNRALHGNAALYQLNEPIAMGVISPSGGGVSIDRQFENILSRTSDYVEQRNDEFALFSKLSLLGKTKKRDLLEYDRKEVNARIDEIAAKNSPTAVVVYSRNNAYFKDQVHVGFSLIPDAVIFRKGETIYSTHIKGDENEEKIFSELMKFLEEVEQKAERKGMLRVPRRRSLIEIPFSMVAGAESEIYSYGGWVEVSACALSDLRTSGPLSFKLKLNPL